MPEDSISNHDSSVQLRSKPDRLLLGMLRLVGTITLLAFGAAVMPEKWIVDASKALGFDPFPDSPLTFYLARNLSALYGFMGAGMLLITMDFERYRPLIRFIALGTMSFGALQLIVDMQSAMPIWWTLSESMSTFAGGVLIGWLDHRCRIHQSQSSDQ